MCLSKYITTTTTASNNVPLKYDVVTTKTASKNVPFKDEIRALILMHDAGV